MKRHDALIPLTHDHHHALAHARGLREAASADDGSRLAGARTFLDFFAADTLMHFREEEEVVFPLLLDATDEPPHALVRVLLEHVRLHGLVARLRRDAERGVADSELMRGIAELLAGHVRTEERELFPLIERVVDQHALEEVELSGRDRPRVR